MSTFFTSDTHFGHGNIIKYSNRPFSSIEEMDETMIRNWNNRVKPGDLVFHLGDFAFGCDYQYAARCYQRLNGIIQFIVGNHDKHLQTMLDNGLLVNLPSYYEEIAQGDQRIVLFHYALRTWHHDLRGVWHLYGHSHNGLPPLGKSVDIGVDRWDFAPVSMEQLRRFMEQQQIHKAPEFANYTPRETAMAIEEVRQETKPLTDSELWGKDAPPDICDFCDSPQVVQRYECMDFKAASADAGVLYSGPLNVVLDSRDYWAACAECSRYVEAENLEGLVKHVCTVFGVPESHPFVRHARHTYALFFKNRIRVKA